MTNPLARRFASFDHTDWTALAVIAATWAYLIALVAGWDGLAMPWAAVPALLVVGYMLFWTLRAYARTRREQREVRARHAAFDARLAELEHEHPEPRS